MLDTHVLIRWLLASKKLSKAQSRILELAVQRGEPVAFSAVSLMEIALLASGDKPPFEVSLDDFLRDLRANPVFQVLPLTYEVALEVAYLRGLRDPADRVIAATARAHRLRLVTSDERIIKSQLVEVIE